jgi:integrase
VQAARLTAAWSAGRYHTGRTPGAHDLRHFFASTFAAGLRPKVIQERLGHATIAETTDTYGTCSPRQASTAAARST